MQYFGKDQFENDVYKYVLENQQIRVGVLNWGGVLQSIQVKNRYGEFVDVLLGCDNMQDYIDGNIFCGALIGRNANRIAGAKYAIDGVEYKIVPNENGTNQLHGGKYGFDRKLWSVEKSDNSLILRLKSPHGEQGFAGNLQAEVMYSIDGNTLEIVYLATSDKDTIFNMTNHAYFNLDGEGSGEITNTTLKICASKYTPVDEKSIPTGEIADVAGTPFDFRAPKKIGEGINADHPQIKNGCGYDHNFAIDGEVGLLRETAVAKSDKSGIEMVVGTTLPGVQLYTGNFVNNQKGKNGKIYNKRSGFCLETQYFPDAMNKDNFQKPILRQGETATSVTSFTFNIVK